MAVKKKNLDPGNLDVVDQSSINPRLLKKTEKGKSDFKFMSGN
jgi:hypothetical protein